MKRDRTDAAWAALCASDPDEMSRDEVAALLGEARVLRAWLDSVEVRAARRLRELEASGRAEPAGSMIANAGGHSSRDGHSITEREELCGQMPDVEEALCEGQISAGYVDAMASAARDLPEAGRAEFTAMAEQLLARASRLSLDAFRRECRQLARDIADRAAGPGDDEIARLRAASKVTRWFDRQTGMHHTLLVLDPLRDSRLHAAAAAELARLRRAAGSERLDWDQLKVEALVNSVAGVTTSTTDDEAAVTNGPGPSDGSRRAVDRVPEATLLISYDWLIGHADHGICETEDGEPLPVATARRLCCDAEIIPQVLGGNGEVLDEGRSRRTASRSQRRALRAMHRGCAHPDCNVGFSSCRIHHVRWWWEHDGPTDIDNLLPLCERHHHLVHEGGWVLTMTPDRVAIWRRPDGAVYHRGTTIDRVEHQLRIA